MFSGPGKPAPASTPPPAISDVLRAGDKITIRLTGVPDDGYIIEMQIPDSGEVTVPLLNHPFQAIGTSAADLASEISQAYKAGQIYTSPNVTVLSEERFVNVGGDVRSPARVVYTSDLTLLSAINSCGGFTDYANRRTVRILRGQQVIQVDATAAARTPGADPALFPGDQVYVPRTAF
jgi:protein involved in polysaccharide export with SLBB domain